MITSFLDKDTVKPIKSTYARIMVISGYYWEKNRRCWLRRGIITMQRFKDRTKPVLEHIAETRAKDDAYHSRDTVPFPEQESRNLGIDLEQRCIDAIISHLTDDPIEAEGTRRDIRELADTFVSLILAPGEPVHPVIRASAVMASLYDYNEHICYLRWMESQQSSAMDMLRSARKLREGSIATLAYVAKCQRTTLEEAARKFRFGKVS
jgi:hypothetical protein